jgi:hypothetical protein
MWHREVQFCFHKLGELIFVPGLSVTDIGHRLCWGSLLSACLLWTASVYVTWSHMSDFWGYRVRKQCTPSPTEREACRGGGQWGWMLRLWPLWSYPSFMIFSAIDILRHFKDGLFCVIFDLEYCIDLDGISFMAHPLTVEARFFWIAQKNSSFCE